MVYMNQRSEYKNTNNKNNSFFFLFSQTQRYTPAVRVGVIPESDKKPFVSMVSGQFSGGGGGGGKGRVVRGGGLGGLVA